MASIFDNAKYGGHGVAESTLMGATFAGTHFYNMVADVDIDNGSVCAVPTPENYVEGDAFKAIVPTKADKIVLVLTAPKIYSEASMKDQEEDNFYNGAGELMRAYEVYETDRFALSVDAFDASATVAVGKYVVVDEKGYKLTTVDTEPIDYGFVGYILKKANNGNYVVFVKRNRQI